MKSLKVVSNYVKLNDSDLNTQASRVLQFMTDNANFPTPVPDMAVYGAAVTDYAQKWEVASKGGSAQDVKLKNESRVVLIDLMKQLAFHVNTVSKGTGSMLESSGFRLIAPDRNIGIPHTPERLRLSDLELSGHMRFDFDAVTDAWEYEYTLSSGVDEGGQLLWGEVQTTTKSRSNELSGLLPGTIYRLRVRARNGRGRSDWSEAVSRMAR
ncbi:Fibronectin type III domain-containing protein [bacterium A37T11]|nr:Fibronectin type III domain-containing protein [bacterium A37T11]